LFAWSLVGGGLGLAAGFVLGEVLGAGKPLPRRWGTRPPPTRRGPVALADAAWAVLRSDETLRGLELHPVGVAPGVVELHGWVPTRSLRARAVRLLQTTPGLERLVDCVLVHGEDDAPENLEDVTDQTA
jgi:hypothetical protein